MSDSDIAIKVEHVSKSFRLPHNRQNSIKSSLINLVKGGDRTFETQEVLKDISFEIKKGEFFGIVGRNGSGKSTLLKLLAGIYTPTSGGIQVNGSLTPFIELGVGFNPELTGRENVFLNGALLGFNRAEMEAMYDDIVSFAEIERFMDQKLKNYSSGMQVRLAFSIAIRARSDILLLDEVLAVGDAAFQAKCFDYFYDLKTNGSTVIFISHDKGSLERFCSRGILIDKGEIIESGPIQTVLDAYTDVVLAQMEGGEAVSPVNVELRDKNKAELKSIELLSNGNPSTHTRFGDELEVRTKIKFNEQTTNPIIGLTLWKKGVDGAAIYAANNLTEAIGELGLIHKNDEIVYSMSMPKFINDGEYIIEVGISNDSATKYLLKEKRALSFNVFGSKNPHALLANDAKMKIEKHEA